MSLANSLRTLKAYASAVGTQIGVGLGSALRHVIILMNTLAKYALKAATAFANFMQTIFGKYKGGASGIAMEGLGDSLDYADDLSGAADGIADGLGSASNAAKDLKKNLSVLPFDELNQLNKDMEETASGGGTGGAGGAGDLGGVTDGLLDWGDLLENSEAGKLPEAISAWAQQIKAAFEGHNWNLLGQIVANGLNKGLQKAYDLLDPKKVSEKVDPWIDAFTTSFNSLVKWFDFDLLGRTVGRGINDVVYILNRTIEGIQWGQLGSQIATGLNGLFDEVNWEELGNLVGNKFMILWNTLQGFVHDFHWDELGTDVANFFNGVFDRVNFTTIADVLATGLNGAFESLATFTSHFNWDDLVTNITDGIKKFISDFEWEKNGQALNDFITHLVDALVAVVGDVDWEDLGAKIADFLAQVEWLKHLKKVAGVMVTVLGGLIKGLLSEPEGAFAAAIILGLGLLKFRDSAFSRLAGNIVKVITGKSFSELIKGGFTTVFTKGVKDATTSESVETAASGVGTSLASKVASGLKSIVTKVASGIATAVKTVAGALSTMASNVGSALSTFASTALGQITLGAGAIVALTYGTAEAQKLVEVARGGNGVLSDFGSALEDLSARLVDLGEISGDQAQELWNIKEAAENAGTPVAEVYQLIADKLLEWGANTETAKNAALDLTNNGLNTESLLGFADALDSIGTGLTETAEQVTANVGTMKSALFDLAQQGDMTGAEYDSLLQILGSSLDTANSTEEAYNIIMQAMELAGIDSTEFRRIYEESIGGVAKDTSDMATGAKKSYDDLTNTTSEAQGKIRDAIGLITDGVHTFQSNWSSKLSDAAQNIFDFASNTSISMSDSSQSVADYESSSKTSMSNNEKDFENLSSNTISSMIKIVTKVGVLATAITGMGTLIKSETSNMENSFSAAFGNITASMTTFKSGINDGLTSIQTTVTNVMNGVKSAATMDLTGAGQSAAQSFASGFQSVHIPVPSISVVGYNYIDFGDGGWASYPVFGLNWYRAGGLFKGGNGSLIGIAEDNRDEAVLPLEDRRAMARIGSAIADAGGSGGMSNDMADKIAERIADIIINTRADYDERPNYIELKVGEEVLARAVTRGQQKLDYRNNPTPKFA